MKRQRSIYYRSDDVIAECMDMFNCLPVVDGISRRWRNVPLKSLDNKDVASLTLLGVSYRFLASDHENHC